VPADRSFSERWRCFPKGESRNRTTPYKRIGDPDDIGRACVWLASEDSDYIHGASIFVEGVMTLYTGFETGGIRTPG